MSAVARVDALLEARPEWKAWLGVVRVGVAGLSDPVWDTGVPTDSVQSDPAPWLAGAVLGPDGRAIARLFDRLNAVARGEGLRAMAGDAARTTAVDEALGVFLAALNADWAALDRRASRTGASPEGSRALARLLPMPYLHACARRWAAGGAGRWSRGYCPVCGAWPAFAEVRGVERQRHLRCADCGAGWPMPALACTYCARTDHESLGSLVGEGRTTRFSVDVCHGCSGYLKSCTTLQATPSDEVLATDLASVEYDLAAVERGFLRPPGPAVLLRASLAVPGSVTSSSSSGEP